MPAPDVVVIGGGMAGLSVAAGLAGRARVRLLEQEPTLASRASGRNAAIYRPLEADDTSAALARRSRALLSELTDRPVLRRSGLLLADASLARVQAEHVRAQALGVDAEVVTGDDLFELHPALVGGEVVAALFAPEAGVLDIHEVLSALERRARGAGALVSTGAEVTALLTEGDRVTGVRLRDGQHIACQHVVMGVGAWAASLAATCGLAVPLAPLRRHLVQLAGQPEPLVGIERPVVWREDLEVYFRAEGDGVLASPCDETDGQPPALGVPCQMAQGAVEQLAQRLARTAPRLAPTGVRSAWACLRTFAPDRQLVLGPDPRVTGLHWIGGLGGKGMSVGPAAGALVADGITGGSRGIPVSLRAERMLSVSG